MALANSGIPMGGFPFHPTDDMGN